MKVELFLVMMVVASRFKFESKATGVFAVINPDPALFAIRIRLVALVIILRALKSTVPNIAGELPANPFPPCVKKDPVVPAGLQVRFPEGPVEVII